MDAGTMLRIDAEAMKLSHNPQEDDYKDAILEVFADSRHLTDIELDDMYVIFEGWKNAQPQR